MARKTIEELEDDVYDLEDDEDGFDDEDDDESQDDEDESDEEDDEEEPEDDEEEEPAKGKKRKVQVDDEEEPRYTAKHMTKIISAKHNKMKNQFSKKYEEAMSQTAGELEASNAVVNWLCQQSNLTKEQVLAKIGFQPSGKKPTIDSKLFDIPNSEELGDDIEAQVNKIKSTISKYPGFKENQKMIIEYAQDTGLPVDKAYWALMGEKAASVARKKGADEVLARKSSKASRVTESSGGTPKVKTYTRDQREAAKASGMSVEDYVKYQSIESYDDYQKIRSKKKRR